jgi:hypothetical protein
MCNCNSPECFFCSGTREELDTEEPYEYVRLNGAVLMKAQHDPW